MIEEPPRLTIKRPSRRPTDDQIAAFQGVATGFVVDALGGRGALSKDIKSLGVGHAHVAGPAITAVNRAGDILATLACLKFVQDGDIVLAGAEGYQGCASAGDRLCGMAQNSGAVALITDGPMRDFDGIVAVGLPTWCSGLSPNSPFSTGPASVGTPLQIGGERVETGDMVVADIDGVVVVPFERIDEVIETLERVTELEQVRDAEVSAGLTIPKDVDELLASDAVIYID